MVGFRERFEREFAGTVKPVRWDGQAASSAAHERFASDTLKAATLHVTEYTLQSRIGRR